MVIRVDGLAQGGALTDSRQDSLVQDDERHRIFSVLHGPTDKNRISISLDLWRLMELLNIPTAVVLSTWIGVAGCGCPSSMRMRQITLASCAFKNNAPNLSSAADAATSLRIAHVIKILPFSLIGSPSSGKLPRKKNLPAWLRARDAVRYEASE